MRGYESVLVSLYAGVTSDPAMQKALSDLADAFDCVSASLLYVHQHVPAATIGLSHGVLSDPAVQAAYKTIYGAHDPAPAVMARLDVGDVTSTDHLFDHEENQRFRYFLSFYHGCGLGGAMGGPVVRTDDEVGMVAVQRSRTRKPFGGEEVDAFRTLMPHVAQVLRLRQRFFSVERRAEDLETAVETIPLGVMVFGADGTIVHANLMAREIIGRADGLRLDRAGRLHAGDRLAEDRLRQWFEAQGARDDGAAFTVSREGGVAPYAVRMRRGRKPAGGTSLLVSDPARPVGDPGRLLAAAYELTPASIRLTSALVEGADLKTYAKRTGISMHTAKHHLNSAFAATGTRRQADLVRLALSLVRDLN